MKTKILFLILAVVSMPVVSYGKASDGDHVFFYNQYGSPAFETINDWTKIGSAGYSTYFSLNSDVDCVEDAVSTESLKTRLDWTVPTSQTVPAGTWCGYEFTIPSGVKENILRWYTAGRYNIGTGAEVRLLDENDNIVWTYSDTGTWVNNYSNTFQPTEKVKLIVYQASSGYLWSGQYFYARLMQMYTQDIPKYFGYYFTNTPSADYYEDSSCDISEFTNLNHVMVSSMTAAQVSALAARYSANGCKMLIDTRWQFFDGSGNLLPQATRELQWSILWDKIEPVLSSVGGMYLIDEPVNRGVSYSDLQTCITEIKADYSGPILAVYAYPTIENLTWGVIPTNIDWVGVDKYSCSFTDIVDLVDNLETYLASWQYIFLVPQATTFKSCSSVANSSLEVEDWQVHNWSWDYWDLANGDPRIVGMLSFLVEDMIDCNMTLTQSAQSDIGTKIK
ncbi:MAG: hypothetical protein ACIAQZ_07545 [Sedimentisphaeraceae bacterium JB056]